MAKVIGESLNRRILIGSWHWFGLNRSRAILAWIVLAGLADGELRLVAERVRTLP